jgi:hypothetical protein
MGLFGFGKKEKVADVTTDFSAQSQSMPDFNQGLGQGKSLYGDPLSDQNSGLKLADLNTQNTGFNQQGGFDSFGNPRVAQRVETFDYNKQQQFGAPDNSKDMQLILAKLDAIRSEITNINHRLDNIERHQTEQPPQKKYPW